MLSFRLKDFSYRKQQSWLRCMYFLTWKFGRSIFCKERKMHAVRYYHRIGCLLASCLSSMIYPLDTYMDRKGIDSAFKCHQKQRRTRKNKVVSTKNETKIDVLKTAINFQMSWAWDRNLGSFFLVWCVMVIDIWTMKCIPIERRESQLSLGINLNA